MPSEKVWSRFERVGKDGKVIKMRIQDLPKKRMHEAIDLMVKYYARDEPVHKAIGVLNDPKDVKAYLQFLHGTFKEPTYHFTICCSDDTDEVKDIMGLSVLDLIKESGGWEDIKAMVEAHGTESAKKLLGVFYECAMTYDPLQKHQLKSFYDDRAILVVPDYRGYGIAQEFLKTRRIMCEAKKVPMTGAWMTNFGTQKAGVNDGWETVCEIKYEDLASKFGITFIDAPPTMKFMIAKAGSK